jgi:hypothetical protein
MYKTMKLINEEGGRLQFIFKVLQRKLQTV